MNFKISVEIENASEFELSIRKGIRDNDPLDIEPRKNSYIPVHLAIYNEKSNLIGGLYGSIMWSWLSVEGLWIDINYRGKGLGRQLLIAAESYALENKCIGVSLGTFDFQAKEFYERQNYTVFAELEDFPPGHTHFHLKKKFLK